jgi:hypothetical protein
MGTTTFSGPIKAGTIKNTTGTTLGTDVKNTGQVVMAQTFSTGTALTSGASAANTTTVVIPANSQIIDIVLDKPTVMVGATCVLSIRLVVTPAYLTPIQLLLLLELDEHIQQLKQAERLLGQIQERRI